MTTRQISPSSLLLGAALLCCFSACSDSEDPSTDPATNTTVTGTSTTDNTAATGNTTLTGNTTDTTTGGTSTTNNTATDTNNLTNTGTTGGTTGGTTTTTNTNTNNTATNTNTNTMATNTMGTNTSNTAIQAYGGCTFNAPFLGQVNPTKQFGGGTLVTTKATYAADSGINALRQRIAAAVAGGTLTMAQNSVTIDPPVVLQGVTLTATSFLDMASMLPRKYFFEDQKEAISFFAGDPATIPFASGAGFPAPDAMGNRPLVGIKADVTVTEVSAFNLQEPQISKVSSFKVLDTNQPVAVREASGTDIPLSEYGKMVRVYGQLGTAAPIKCPERPGRVLCYDLLHGTAAAPKTVTFRVNDAIKLNAGDCVSFVGPVNAFPGPFDPNSQVQLDASNFSWQLNFKKP